MSYLFEILYVLSHELDMIVSKTSHLFIIYSLFIDLKVYEILYLIYLTLSIWVWEYLAYDERC